MTSRKFFLFFAALVAFSIGLATTQASAQAVTPCCFSISNSTACSVTYYIVSPSGPVGVTVQPNSQVTVTLNAECDAPTLYLIDQCGNRRVVPVQGCTIANLGSCCVRVCLQRDLTRCWQVTTTISPLCYACPILEDDHLR